VQAPAVSMVFPTKAGNRATPDVRPDVSTGQGTVPDRWPADDQWSVTDPGRSGPGDSMRLGAARLDLIKPARVAWLWA
jgi:hypothetical protein